MNVGRLKHKITIQEKTKEKNGYGELKEIWTNVYTDRRVEIKPVTGKSFWSAQQINSEITHQVITRYADRIKPSMRIVFKGRVFEILYVMNFNEAEKYLQIMCKELVK
ncbi:MAG: phage head closure protein [Peptostreptococcaceae bacterium]